MQPISGTPPRPPGEGPVTPNTPGEQPLSTQQRTVLERLITRLIALTSQQNAEVWAGVKHDLGVRNDAPLQSRHFPAAEQKPEPASYQRTAATYYPPDYLAADRAVGPGE